MGRTVPSFRATLDGHVERLRTIGSHIVDPELRADFEELLEHSHDLENVFAEFMGSPQEEVVLSLLLYVYHTLKAGNSLAPRSLGEPNHNE